MSTIKTNAIQTTAGKPILNSTGSILQVVQTIKQDTFTTSSQSYTNVTGLSATITPSSTSSKILINCYLTTTNGSQVGNYLLVTRNGSTISGSLSTSGTLNTTSSAVQSSSGFIVQSGTTYTVVPLTLQYLDSPASTSAQTYQVQTRTGSTGSVLVNYQGGNSTANNNPDFGYYISSITLLEVSA
jgi:hypothetical protein